DQYRIRRIDPTGTITTIAGTGTNGSSGDGDGGPATSAAIGLVSSLAIDASGNLYLAESVNNRVRMINAASVITTIAGTGATGSSGDGGPAVAATLSSPEGLAVGANGTLYIADQGNNRVRAITGGTINMFAGTGAPGFSGEGGMATAAELDAP